MFRHIVAASIAPAALAAALLCALPSAAATLNAVDLTNASLVVQDDGSGTPEQPRLFSTEIKRDQNVQNSGGSGQDAFLRDAATANQVGFNVSWGASGSLVNWSLGLSGTTATLTVDGTTRNLTLAGGNWNVLSFFLRADDTQRFTSSSVNLAVTHANGAALDTALALSVTNGQYDAGTFALPDFQTIQSIAGTVRFDFALVSGARGSPNSRLAFSMGARQVTPVVPPPVPVPAAMPLLLGALAGLAMLRRHVRQTA